MEHFRFHSSSKAIEIAIQKLATRTGHVATATATVAKASARVASNTVAVAKASGRVVTATVTVARVSGQVVTATVTVARNSARVATATITVAKASARVATATVTVARASARVASNTVAVARTKSQVERVEGHKQHTPQDGKPDAFCALSSLKDLPLGKAYGKLAAFLMSEKHGLLPPVPGLALIAHQKKLSSQRTSSTAYRS